MKNGPYTLVIPPEDYPGKRYRGRYAYEHHVVFWQWYGKLPQPGEVIHHINGDKRCNLAENLQLVNLAEHVAQHNREAHPRVHLICPVCLSAFSLQPSKFEQSHRNRRVCCSRNCAIKGR